MDVFLDLNRSKYNAHTDPLFKSCKLLKFEDLVQLDQVIFMRQYSNNFLPESFNNFFKYIPLEDQKCRDDDYNFSQKQFTNKDLFYYPAVQLTQSWNRANITLKSEGEIATVKTNFISTKMLQYSEECSKVSCFACGR